MRDSDVARTPVDDAAGWQENIRKHDVADKGDVACVQDDWIGRGQGVSARADSAVRHIDLRALNEIGVAVEVARPSPG